MNNPGVAVGRLKRLHHRCHGHNDQISPKVLTAEIQGHRTALWWQVFWECGDNLPQVDGSAVRGHLRP